MINTNLVYDIQNIINIINGNNELSSNKVLKNELNKVRKQFIKKIYSIDDFDELRKNIIKLFYHTDVDLIIDLMNLLSSKYNNNEIYELLNYYEENNNIFMITIYHNDEYFSNDINIKRKLLNLLVNYGLNINYCYNNQSLLNLIVIHQNEYHSDFYGECRPYFNIFDYINLLKEYDYIFKPNEIINYINYNYKTILKNNKYLLQAKKRNKLLVKY